MSQARLEVPAHVVKLFVKALRGEAALASFDNQEWRAQLEEWIAALESRVELTLVVNEDRVDIEHIRHWRRD